MMYLQCILSALVLYRSGHLLYVYDSIRPQLIKTGRAAIRATGADIDPIRVVSFIQLMIALTVVISLYFFTDSITKIIYHG